ncbi:uncharacterized protein LOC106653477 isoform X2 [Trichogramma pretiosum]|uniref:uncharacterized protein LOC106653477 isoform X2 n=1 Tax=Trichogramma pretiosum TaxID=7493 RepID=UPI000C71A0F7|nr:uncharacterized protein LOC106653477 isoform X2 [Trichogramma pretiosum]
MVAQERRKSSDQIDPNNRVEDDQSDDETPPNGAPAGGNSGDESDDGSTVTIRLIGEDPANAHLSPEERLRLHMENWYRSQVEDTSSNTPQFPPLQSIWDLDRNDWCTLAILAVGLILLGFQAWCMNNRRIRDMQQINETITLPRNFTTMTMKE